GWSALPEPVSAGAPSVGEFPSPCPGSQALFAASEPHANVTTKLGARVRQGSSLRLGERGLLTSTARRTTGRVRFIKGPLTSGEVRRGRGLASRSNALPVATTPGWGRNKKAWASASGCFERAPAARF